MADKSFDVIIVGGGNKGLVASMYLAKFGGMNVGIFEERHELGGGWSSEEPVPGFVANTCSTEHFPHYHIPVKEDIPEFVEYGCRYAHTPIGADLIFLEDHSCICFYSSFEDVDPTQEKTAKGIARFSEKDAETWLWMVDKFNKKWYPRMLEWAWNPARPFGEPDGMDKLFMDPESGIDPIWLYMSPMQVYMDVFESVEMQLAFCRPNQSFGFQTDQAAMGAAALIWTVFTHPNAVYTIGGSHQLAHAAQRVILENGGRVFTRHPVKQIIIENGQAKGIRLEDGTEIEAKKAVVTTVDPYQLCFNLIGKEHISSKILNRVARIQREWITITWYTWALRERPRYLAEEFNPDVWNSSYIGLTDRDMDSIVRECSEKRLMQWPSKLNLTLVHHGTGPDDMLAPPGIDFNVLSEQFVLPAYVLSDKEWKEWEKKHAEEVIEHWQKYAPNMTWDNVIGYNPVTPYYTANQCRNYGPAGNWAVIDHIPSQMGRFRPIPELADHRTPIKHLYATGSAWHPYAGGHSCQGYNCYKVMAEDMGLKKPWEEKGRPW